MKASQTERRRSVRCPLPQGVVIMRKGLNKWFGKPSPYAKRLGVLDISEGGVCFENHGHQETFVPGDKVVFQVQGSHLDSFRASGKVAWITFRRKNGAAKIQIVGVSFKNVPRWARREISGLS